MGVERLEPGNPFGDLGTSLADQAGQLDRRVCAMTGVVPAADPGDILERDVEPPQVDQQAQVLEVRFP